MAVVVGIGERFFVERLPGTTSRPNPELLGSWRVHNLSDGRKATYEIAPDGTFKYDGQPTGTWTVNNGQ